MADRLSRDWAISGPLHCATAPDFRGALRSIFDTGHMSPHVAVDIQHRFSSSATASGSYGCQSTPRARVMECVQSSGRADGERNPAVRGFDAVAKRACRACQSRSARFGLPTVSRKLTSAWSPSCQSIWLNDRNWPAWDARDGLNGQRSWYYLARPARQMLR